MISEWHTSEICSLCNFTSLRESISAIGIAGDKIRSQSPRNLPPAPLNTANTIVMSTLLSLISNSSSLGSPVAIILPSSPPAEPYGPRDPQEHPEYEQEELTHADFRSLVLSFRAILVEELGVTAKDVVALSMANTVEFMVAFVGITVSRSVFTPT